jgi:hypothetical protein
VSKKIRFFQKIGFLTEVSVSKKIRFFQKIGFLTKVFLVPTLCVGMPAWTLRVLQEDLCWTRRAQIFSRSHALRGNACLDAPRPAK